MRLYQGDCQEILKNVGTVDAIITDPPYGLSREPDINQVLENWTSGKSYTHGFKGFMGKNWDSFVPGPEIWKEAHKALAPGGYLFAFAGTRTQGLMAKSIELAGFRISPVQLSWVYGSGFPKSLDRSLAAPAAPEAQQWSGWGTALKPAHEPIIVAFKPTESGANPGLHFDWAPFHYAAKASKRERNLGCGNLFWRKENDVWVRTSKEDCKANKGVQGNHHPTVKPVQIMSWLLSLVPKAKVICDPFMGSGTTGLACKRASREFIGIELERASFVVAQARLGLAEVRSVDE